MAVSEIPSSSGGSGEDPKEARKTMRDMLGPQAVDQLIRQAISTCWMMLPENKKNVGEVEAQIRRLVERALQNLKDDARTFGMSEMRGEHEHQAGKDISMEVVEATCTLPRAQNVEEARTAMRDMLGPQAVDQLIRQAISACWMILPNNKKNVAEVEGEIRQLLERSLQNLKEDAHTFGLTETS